MSLSAVLKTSLPEKLEPLFSPARYKVLYGGRGGSKSWGVARALLLEGWRRKLRILCAREIQRTIADSVHRLLSDQIPMLGLEGFYHVKAAEILGLNGTEFLFAGLRQQDVTKVRSLEGVDICWVEEAQVVSKKSWDTLVPTIRKDGQIIRKDGSEIWITFNPELDSDETYVRFVARPPEGAVVININWRDNPWFPETLRKEKDALKRSDPEGYENVWEGKCRSTVEGAIYHKEVLALIESHRVRPVPVDPLLKVHTVWDLGYDTTAIIFVQRLHSEVRVVDYIEDTHRTFADYVSEIRERRWNWGSDWLPHDAKAHSSQTGKSAREVVLALGRSVQLVPDIGIEPGIKAARLLFPRVYMDETRCQRLLTCLKRYRRQIPTTTNEPAAPLHDEYSHGSDAWRYLAVIVDRLGNEDRLKPIKYPPSGVV